MKSTWIVITSLVVSGLVWGCTAAQSKDDTPQRRAHSADRADIARDLVLFGGVRAAEVARRADPPLQQHTFTSSGRDTDPDVDRTGKWMVFASTRHHAKPSIYLQATDGRAVAELTGPEASDVQPAFSPDGQRVAFASDRSGNWDIWVLSLTDSTVTQVTDSPDPEMRPTWSPDGRRLAYCRLNRRGGVWEVWVAPLEGPGQPRMLAYGLNPRWSPTGDRIVYQRARDNGEGLFSIWILPLHGDEPGAPVEIAYSGEYSLILPSWSPDGQQVVFNAVRVESLRGSKDGRRRPPVPEEAGIWVVQADGSGVVNVVPADAGHFGPVWSADGRIYFASNRSGVENLWSVSPVREVTAWGRAAQVVEEAGPAVGFLSEHATGTQGLSGGRR